MEDNEHVIILGPSDDPADDGGVEREISCPGPRCKRLTVTTGRYGDGSEVPGANARARQLVVVVEL